MNGSSTGNSTDRMRSILVVIATAATLFFNWLASSGRFGVTPGNISDAYPTVITPAGYTFAIWSLIYTGLVAFSIYQLLRSNAVKYRSIRSLYILTCLLNCLWLYVWMQNQIAASFGIIFTLTVITGLICARLRDATAYGEFWLAKMPFGLYFGWLTAATFVNFFVLLSYLNVEMSVTARTVLAVALLLMAAVFGVLVRLKLTNYLYPLAIAWALTGIAVEQSGKNTAVVVACAIGVIVTLIATVSFVLSLSSEQPEKVSSNE